MIYRMVFLSLDKYNNNDCRVTPRGGDSTREIQDVTIGYFGFK